jgi:hypothetical protein
MPGMDKTGSCGTGPKGRGMGPCGGGLAYQRGNGWGMGRGYRRSGFGVFSTPVFSADEEKTFLEQRRNWLKTQIEAVEKQLENLNKPEE